jgi:ribosomal protein S27AE
MGMEETLENILVTLRRLEEKVDSLTQKLEDSGTIKNISFGGAGKTDAGESESRAKCPKCGSTSSIQKEDKSRPINYMGGVPIYAKIRSCKQCGTEY